MNFTIKNYRCFEDTNPLKFDLEDGFMAFVGPNNAGKSSILKFFFEFRHLWNVLTHPNSDIVTALKGGYIPVDPLGTSDPNEILCNYNDRDIQIEIRFPNIQASSYISKMVISIRRKDLHWVIQMWDKDGATINGLAKTADGSWKGNYMVRTNDGSGLPGIDFSNVFDECSKLARSMYIGSFRNIINVGGNVSYFDISVGSDFVKTWRDWKTGPNKFRNRKTQEIQTDIQEIFKFKSLEISDSADLNTLQVYINKNSYKLNEIGAGIAEFIITLGNVAIKQPAFVFIDEPELHLHPALQLQFLMMLSSYSQNGVVFATHSIGLARSAAERIYSVTQDKDEKGLIRKFEETTRLPEFLGELSFSSFKDLGYSKVFLVEGPHEVKTIQQLLRQLKKDNEYLLIPLGGDSMINGDRGYELSELKRMSDNIAVLIDSEKTSVGDSLSSNREDFIKICKENGFKCHVLERRAIENYLIDSAIKKIKGDKHQALTPYQKLNEVDPCWAKSENWKIIREMKIEDIAETDLGKFIKSL